MGKRHGIPILMLAVLMSLLLVYALGCGGGGSTSGRSGSLSVRGTLGTGYSPPPDLRTSVSGPSTSRLSLSNGVVTRITALPNIGGALNANSIIQAKTSTVGADGTFSLSLDKDKNWVLVL